MRSHTRALTGMAFVFNFTLLTIENGGALFLLTVAVLIFLEAQFDACKKADRLYLLQERNSPEPEH